MIVKLIHHHTGRFQGKVVVVVGGGGVAVRKQRCMLLNLLRSKRMEISENVASKLYCDGN